MRGYEAVKATAKRLYVEHESREWRELTASGCKDWDLRTFIVDRPQLERQGYYKVPSLPWYGPNTVYLRPELTEAR